jgi:hypothetical protein
VRYLCSDEIMYSQLVELPEDPDIMMTLAALQTSLERVDEALAEL